MSDTNQSPSASNEDTVDLVLALTNIWLALEAIHKNLPVRQERSVALTLSELAKVLNSLMTRHNITSPTEIANGTLATRNLLS